MAEKGDARAQSNLGVVYSIGVGITQNYQKAVKWQTKAARQWHAGAQYNLAKMYDNSQGVAKDHKKAFAWFTLAGENAEEKAIKRNAVLAHEVSASQLTSLGIEQTRTLSDEYYKKYVVLFQ